MNIAIAATKLARMPNRATAHVLSNMNPVEAARNAVDSHCASSWLSPSAPITDGSAMFTIVAAVIVPMEPIASTRMSSATTRAKSLHKANRAAATSA